MNVSLATGNSCPLCLNGASSALGNSPAGQCSFESRERNALMAVKAAWISTAANLSGWQVTLRPCLTFTGVTCANNRVTMLSLTAQSIYGTISSRIGELDQLQIIRLNSNFLFGKLPSELGLLTALVDLVLYNNDIGGWIPTQLPMAKYIDLESNQFTGTIPTSLGLNTRLTDLWLTSNLLTGRIPSQLFFSTKISYIRLEKNFLTGRIPTQVSAASTLRYLFASQNLLTGSLPSQLGALTALVQLILNENLLSGTIPTQIENRCPSYTDSSFQCNLFRAPKISKCMNASSLSGSPCYSCLKGSSSALGNSPAGQCSYDTRELNALMAIKAAWTSTVVNLTGWQFSLRPCETFTGVFCGANNRVEVLSLPSSGIVGRISSQIGQLDRLREIDLNTNQLIGSLPTELGLLTRLKILALFYNTLSGVIPSQLPSLTRLDMEGNVLSGTIPPTLGLLTELDVLWLNANQLSGIIPTSLFEITSLSRLNLDRNLLTGLLPTEIGFMTKLTNFRVDSNFLTGSIPSEIAKIGTIDALGLSENRFTGMIPAELESFCSGSQLRSFQCNILLGPAFSSCVTYGLLDSFPSACENCPAGTQPVLGNVPRGQCSYEQTERDALLAMKASWTVSIGTSTWVNTTLPCSNGWKSVFCENSRVTRLNLAGTGLTGRLSSNIGVLNKLVELNLIGNELVGSIPTQIGLLTDLQSLYLNQNKFTGRIPSQLGLLTRLTVLFLQRNLLQGTVPSQVESLCTDISPQVSMECNMLESPTTSNCMPSSTPACPAALCPVESTPVTGNLPPAQCFDRSRIDKNALLLLRSGWKSSTGLSSWISSTMPCNPTPWLYVSCSATRRVTGLNLQSRSIVGTLASSIGDLSELATLNLQINQLYGSIPVQINSLTKLTALQLQRNRFNVTLSVAVENLCGRLSNATAQKNFSCNRIPGPASSRCMIVGTAACLLSSCPPGTAPLTNSPPGQCQ